MLFTLIVLKTFILFRLLILLNLKKEILELLLIIF